MVDCYEATQIHSSMPNEAVDQQSCFVIMPFGGKWDRYYEQYYSPAITDAKLTPVRADEVFRAGSVLHQIVDKLSAAAMVLADVSESNRNVHYELGLAHALGKPTILVAPAGMSLFFDVSQERMIVYDKEDGQWGAQLRTAIANAIKDTLRDPASAVPTAFIHIKPSRIDTDEVTLRLRRIEELLIKFTNAQEPGRLQGLLKSMPAAEAEAEELLKRMDERSALKYLLNSGYGQIMARDAVTVAAARIRQRAKSSDVS